MLHRVLEGFLDLFATWPKAPRKSLREVLQLKDVRELVGPSDSHINVYAAVAAATINRLSAQTIAGVLSDEQRFNRLIESVLVQSIPDDLAHEEASTSFEKAELCMGIHW
jgi:hypothetical protein